MDPIQPLVGRSREAEFLAGVLTGERRTVLVNGEAGVGKTTLLARLCDDAGGQGWRVLRSSCVEAEQPYPYAGLHQVLTALGFTINPLFSDHNAACVVVEDDHSYFMILTREYFQTFSDRPIGDPSVTVSAATAIFLDTRAAVDEAVTAGLAAGGSEAKEPTDLGFMYQRQLTDPDGNVLEFGYMDPVAAAQGPEAFMNQQA